MFVPINVSVNTKNSVKVLNFIDMYFTPCDVFWKLTLQREILEMDLI